MKVSLNWIRDINQKYQCAADPAPDGIDKLVEKIGAQLGAVEEVIDLGKRYKGIVIVKIVSVKKHPNADKLTICLVDDRKAVKTVKRDKDGLIQIVCGAPNVKADMLAAWIPPGVTLPASYEKEPLVIEGREIRGVASNGMLASHMELAISEIHEGLLGIDENAKPGTSFAEIYSLNDYIIDIENKMFTHRPDCFGMLGIARELAGIQHQSFKSPAWYKADAKLPENNRGSLLKLTLKNQVPKLVPRFCLVAMSDIKVGESPIWLQTYLSRVGFNPINNIVDLTNFLMLETAQPLHAYDYDKLLALQPRSEGVEMGVRLSKKGEKLDLLGGASIELEVGAIVITANNQPVGLGGIRGGGSTAIDENTKNIVLECGNFDMNLTRHTAMAYGQFTDAATRFTKSQSPLQNTAVLAKAVESIKEVAGGRVASKPIDDKHIDSLNSLHKPVLVGPDFINIRLGLNLVPQQIKKLLQNVEFVVEEDRGGFKITAPFWRTDIQIPEDIVEEVGRLYGYDHLPVILPSKDLTPPALDEELAFKSRLRGLLAAAGANELLTHSFVHDSLMEKAGQDSAQAYHLRNALSPDLQSYRLSLTPSLLDKVSANIRGGYDQFALFEMNKVHSKTEVDEHGLPKEFSRLALVWASSLKKGIKTEGAAYFRAKKYLSYLSDKLKIEIQYKLLDEVFFHNHRLTEQMIGPFESQRSAGIFIGNKMVGVVGEYRAEVRQALKLPNQCSGLEIFMSALQGASASQYHPLNRFPAATQDFCLRSSVSLSYSLLEEFMHKELQRSSKKHGYIYEFMPLDIYRRPKDLEHKQTTWRITLAHPQRTLTTNETNRLLDGIAAKAKQELKAERI